MSFGHDNDRWCRPDGSRTAGDLRFTTTDC